MTSGEKLKIDLKLKKFKKGSVKIARFINFSQVHYVICYDSKYINVPLTTNRIKQSPFIAMLYKGEEIQNNSSSVVLTPFLDLEEFNGTVNGSLFLVVDLAGQQLQNKNVFENNSNCKSFVNENKLKEVSFFIKGKIDQLLEGSGFHIDDLRKNAISPITKKAYDIRQNLLDKGVILESVIWSEKEDNLLLQFFVIPTFKQKVKTYTMAGVEKNDNHYETEILFLEVGKFLGNKKSFLLLSKSNQIELVRKLIKEGEVLIFANDPSWYYQGGFERADELGYSIYPFKGTHGKDIWAKRHGIGIYITKHMAQTLSVIPNLAPEIAQKIREEK